MPVPPAVGGKGIMFSSCFSGHCPSVNTYFAWHDISLCKGGISFKWTAESAISIV